MADYKWDKSWNLTPVDSVIHLDKWKTQLPNTQACLRTCFTIAGYEANSAKAIQLYTETDKLEKSMNFNEAISLIDISLSHNMPVIAGVYRKAKNAHKDNGGLADHFVVIVGSSADGGRKYYRFVDPGTAYPGLGISPLNKFYIYEEEKKIMGNSAYKMQSLYTVSQIRPK